MGAAGDMLFSALAGLLPDPDGLMAECNAAFAPLSVTFCRVPDERRGVSGFRTEVLARGEAEAAGDAPHPAHTHAHGHRTLSEVLALLNGLVLPDAVKARAAAVYERVAAAEAEVHGKPVSELHFHELGMLDALADIAGCCLALERLAPARIVCSPIRTGFGQVRCAHGVLPVPAPATALLLRGAPILAGEIEGELCTPTGAALVTGFAQAYSELPPMAVERISVGLGHKDFPAANCLRAFWGEAMDAACAPNDALTLLSCNVDDMTGEAMAFAMEELMAAGALDVSALPILMKKGRPAYELRCLCLPADGDRFAALMLLHTTSFGVRRREERRYSLERGARAVETELGSMRVKRGAGYGAAKTKVEYADAADAARRGGVPLVDAFSAAADALRKETP